MFIQHSLSFILYHVLFQKNQFDLLRCRQIPHQPFLQLCSLYKQVCNFLSVITLKSHITQNCTIPLDPCQSGWNLKSRSCTIQEATPGLSFTIFTRCDFNVSGNTMQTPLDVTKLLRHEQPRAVCKCLFLSPLCQIPVWHQEAHATIILIISFGSLC